MCGVTWEERVRPLIQFPPSCLMPKVIRTNIENYLGLEGSISLADCERSLASQDVS